MVEPIHPDDESEPILKSECVGETHADMVYVESWGSIGTENFTKPTTE